MVELSHTFGATPCGATAGVSVFVFVRSFLRLMFPKNSMVPGSGRPNFVTGHNFIKNNFSIVSADDRQNICISFTFFLSFGSTFLGAVSWRPRERPLSASRETRRARRKRTKKLKKKCEEAKTIEAAVVSIPTACDIHTGKAGWLEMDILAVRRHCRVWSRRTPRPAGPQAPLYSTTDSKGYDIFVIGVMRGW